MWYKQVRQMSLEHRQCGKVSFVSNSANHSNGRLGVWDDCNNMRHGLDGIHWRAGQIVE